MTTPEMPPEYLQAEAAIEAFKAALLEAIPTNAPIDLDICLAAFNALEFVLEEWQQIEKMASSQIDQLRSELFFTTTNTTGTA
jgi:hypothetical protein